MRSLNVIDNTFDSLRLLREGVAESTGSVVEYDADAVSDGSAIAAKFFGTGFIGYVRKVTVTTSSDTPIAIQIAFYFQDQTSYVNAIISSTCSFTIEDLWIPGFSSGDSTRAQIQVEWKEAIASFTGNIAVAFDAVRLTNDLNLSAAKRILVVGDSISIGSLGEDCSDTDIYPWKIRDYFRANNYDVRLINKGVGGIDSTDVEVSRKFHWYDIDEPALIIYAIGTNNISGGFDESKQTTYSSNVNSFIDWKQLRYPNAKLLMLGPPPSEDATKESNLVVARALMSAAVTTQDDNLVKYINLGTAFTPTDTTKYNPDEGVGSRVHLNIAGHLAVYNVIENYFNTNNYTI